MALATTLICILLAYPLAWLIARSPKKHQDLMVLLAILPFASNFLIRVYAWMIILGPQAAVARALNGLLAVFGFEPVTLLFSPFAVLVGMVYVHLPFMILPLYTNLEKHDPALLDAAQDLGANAWQRFWRVTWPLSLPGIYSGSALVFIPVLGMFAIPDILGGTRDILIGNLIKEQFLGTRDWPFGATLSHHADAGRAGVRGAGCLAGAARSRPPCVRNPLWLWAAALAAYAFLYLPLLIVVLYSFNDSRLNAEWVGFTLHWYSELFNDADMLLAARNSLLIAAGRQPGGHRAGHLAGTRHPSLPAAHPADARRHPGGDARNPARRQPAAVLQSGVPALARPRTRHVVGHRAPTSPSASASSPSSCGSACWAWTRASSRPPATSAPRPGRPSAW